VDGKSVVVVVVGRYEKMLLIVSDDKTSGSGGGANLKTTLGMSWECDDRVNANGAGAGVVGEIDGSLIQSAATALSNKITI
jgi:hypothetical protein